jgi:oligopeptide transport system substrate-binding protein
MKIQNAKGVWRSFWVGASVLTVLVSTAPLSIAANPADQIINIGNGAEPKDLDPHIVTGVPEHHILQNLFEPLVSKDPKTLNPAPGVAEKWKLSKDGKVYTFTLRKNAKWSNGDPVTAHDFIYSWTRLLTPATAAEYAYQGHYIKNGKPFNEGTLKDASQLGLKAIDDYTLEVTLENATPFFLSLLYHHSLYPVHKATIEKHKGRWTRPENMVVNGAFQMSKWETNKIIVLVKNPNYWDKEKVALTKVNIYPTENQDTEEQMFRTGQLHVTYEVPLEKLDYWRKDKSGVFQSHPYLGTYFYRINVTKGGLKDVRVRKALNLAIDREKIMKFVSKGNQVPATAFTPPNTAGYTPKSVLPSDVSRVGEAKKLLAEAGFPEGKGLGPIEIHYNTNEGHKKIAEAVQQMLKQNLGVDVRLFNQEWKVYLDSQRTLSYQLSRAGWIGDYNDPNTFLDMWVTNGGNNNTGWSNKEYDKLIADAAKELNAKKRLAIFQKAEDILLTELPVIPIYIYKRNYLKSPLVQGWYPNIEDIHPLKHVSLGPQTVASAKK